MATPFGNAWASRWRWVALVLAGLVVFGLSPAQETLDRGVFDAASRHPFRDPAPPDGSALVLMDRATMDALSQQGIGGTWPPPRATFAALIAGLERAGARRIVVDFIFVDHSANAEQDELLGALAAGLPNVSLARTAQQRPVFWDDSFVAAHAGLFASSRDGLADGTPDRDGVLRRYSVPGSLAAAAFAASPAAPGGLLHWYGGLARLQASGGRVPVLSAARFLVAGLSTVSQLSDAEPDNSPERLREKLASEPPLTGAGFDDVRGRIVFVGANTEGTFDQKPFAIGGLEPGVLMHWTAWADLTAKAFIHELPWWLAPAVALLWTALVTAAGWQGSGLLFPGLVAFGLAVGTLGAAYLGLSEGWFLPPSLPVAACGFTLLGVAVDSFWRERRRRQDVQAMFGSYVAPEIVELLVRDPCAIRLGGERREATVFFCDLAGFTDLSEQVPPEQLLELVNGYLQDTSDGLMAHGAYVDKYIGDAVMAVFGAPKPLPDHSLAACRAALAVQRRMAGRNVQLAATHGRTLGLRIGLNSGEMIVGNLGSERKKNYTVLGDAVNLASRLEGANKEFGTSILVGENTARSVGDRLVLRPLTALRVKGKHTAVIVFELIGEPGDIPAAQKEFLQAYAAGHALYTSRRFEEAVPALETAARLAPADRTTLRLLADSRRLAIEPPPADWQPILKLETK